MAILPVGISAEEGSFKIERSLRFNSADSAYLNRTPASASNRKTWTWSGWVKRGILTTRMSLIGGYSGTAQGDLRTEIIILDGAAIQIASTQMQVAEDFNLITSQVFRDPSAWYHIVLAVDTTQATSSNRVKLYVNGVQVTSFSSASYPSQDYQGAINLNNFHYINRFYDSTNGNYYGDGYLTEINFIDGSALTPSSFGETDSDTGVWKPKAYSGSYGTNGFYLDFGDNSSTTALGYDAAGSNDWTPNNFSVTAGAGNDSLVDSPTRYGTDTGVGGEVRGNYATLNPLAKTSNVTLTNGNLDAAFGTVSGGGGVIGTIAPSSGKWYWEVTVTAASSASIHIGVIKDVLTTFSGTQYYEPGLTADGYAYQNDGTKYNNNTNTSYGASYTTNDVIGVAMDLDAGTLTFYKNNTSQGQAFSGLSGGYFPAVGDGSSAGTHSVTMNFGQRPFAYTAPSGFKALCTTNLPEPTVADGEDYFNAVLWTGDGTGDKSITGVGFQPDFVWTKPRSAATGHRLSDAVRGSNIALFSQLTNAEVADATGGYIDSFDSDGFSTVSGATNNDNYNASARTYVAWNWKANGAGVLNEVGTIDSTVSANTTAGFSIVTYTGTGSNATVGHGLGVAPSMVIVKQRDTTRDWPVYHANLTSAAYTIFLNSTAAQSSITTTWNSTAPTSSVFSVGSNAYANQSSGTYVAYCFAPIAGYSAFGSYTGTSTSDGAFIYTGFRPAFVLAKMATGVDNWFIYDNKRDTYNVETQYLLPNSSGAEGSYGQMDFLSNGFKLRVNDSLNYDSTTYIYAAFAESPMKFALGR